MASRKRKSRMTPNQFPRECLFCSKVYRGSGACLQKTFSSRYPKACSGALEVHMNQHTGEHPYECTECPSIFTDHRYLGLHMDQVHIGKKFICGGCHQEYYSQGTLNRHRNRGYCSGVKKIKKISKASKKIHIGKIKAVVPGKLGKVTRKAGKNQGDCHPKLSGDTKKMTSKTVKIDKAEKSIDKSSGQGKIKKERKSVSEKEVPRKLGEKDGDNFGRSSSAKTIRISSKTNLQSLKSGIILKTRKSVTRPCGPGKIKMKKKPVIEKAVMGNPNQAKRPSRIKTEENIDQKPVVPKSAVYKCSQCPTTHLDRNLLLKHAADCHELKTFECPICKNLYTQYQNMTRHLKTAHGDEEDSPLPELTKWRERRTKCSLCDMAFESFPRLLEHRKIEHNLKLFKCTYCPNEYTQYSNMARHRKSHGDDNPGIGMQQTAPVTRARVYTTTNETTAKKEKNECTRIPVKASEQHDTKLDQFPVFVNGEENGLSENSLPDQAHQQLLQMVAQLRIQKEQNIDQDVSFFLHLNRYDPSCV